MKKKLIMAVLLLSFTYSLTHANTSEVDKIILLDRLKNSDFKGRPLLDVFYNIDHFTPEEKEQFYNYQIDWRQSHDKRNDNEYRFNRKVIEPKLSDGEFKKRQAHIQTLLDECVLLVREFSGEQNKPMPSFLKIQYKEGYMSIFMYGPPSNNVFHIQPNYLSPRMRYCKEYLYSKKYDFSDFEYDHLKNAEQNIAISNKRLVEAKYEVIYLHIKAAGLLRKLEGSFYPKSFLREHADQTGLTTFIHQAELKANKQLKHDELAIQFFGSRDRWIESFYRFLNQKSIELKIGL